MSLTPVSIIKDGFFFFSFFVFCGTFTGLFKSQERQRILRKTARFRERLLFCVVGLSTNQPADDQISHRLGRFKSLNGSAAEFLPPQRGSKEPGTHRPLTPSLALLHPQSGACVFKVTFPWLRCSVRFLHDQLQVWRSSSTCLMSSCRARPCLCSSFVRGDVD